MLPFTEWVVRFPSVLIGALNVVLAYFLSRRLWPDARLALVAGALLILTPAHFIQSRIAMDYIYPVPFVLAWALCLLRKGTWFHFTCGVILGFGVYSYIASIVMMPIYLAITVFVILFVYKDGLKSAAMAVTGFAIAVLPIVIWLQRHPGVVQATLNRYPGPTAEITAQGLGALIVTKLVVYAQFFNPIFLFVWGGYASPMNSTPHAGVFPVTFLLLVPVGIWRTLTRRDVPSLLVLVLFFSAPVAAVLAVSEPWAIDREMAIVPFGALLAAEGYRWLAS